MNLVKVAKTWIVLENDQVVVASKEFKIFGQNGKVLAEGVKLREWCREVGITDVVRVKFLSERQATACCEYILRMQDVSEKPPAAQAVDEEQQEFRELLLDVCERFDWELAEIVSATVEYRITNNPGEVVQTKNFSFSSEDSRFLAVVEWATASEAKKRLNRMEEACNSNLRIASKENSERQPPRL